MTMETISSTDFLTLSALTSRQPEIYITYFGHAMDGAGLAEGDELRLRLRTTPRDGDVVVAFVDGEPVVRAVFADDRQHRWLLACSEGYDAVPLDSAGVRLLGTVVGLSRREVRVSSVLCLQSLARSRQQEPPTAQEVAAAIRTVAPKVLNSRQWYAVCRALADCGAVDEDSHRDFCRLVAQTVPAHPFLPVAKELGRMAVQSFSKRVDLWRADDAPVSGQRFDYYLSLARMTADCLARRD